MVVSEKIKKVPHQPDFVFWVASVGESNTCAVTRVSGFVIEEDDEHLTFFLPQKLFSIIEPVLKPDSNISFLMASVRTFESYQVKGKYKDHRSCTEENIDFYRLKMLKIIDILTGMGMNGRGFDFLLEQPGMAVTMHCLEVYEQTPKPGTGGKLN